MPATATIDGITRIPHRPVSEWLRERLARRGTPKRWARTIGCSHHTLYDRQRTGAAWTADDLARLLVADPELAGEFDALLTELRACTSE